jgi:myo-inositol-1(or 4)-monophosphatase
MAEHDLQAIHDFMILIAEKAGDMITSAKPSGSNVDLKKNCRMLLPSWSYFATNGEHDGENPSVPQAETSAIIFIAVDLVTETDQAVEKVVSTSLKEQYPSFSFMGEETYKPGDMLTDNPTFIVDPIDGTTNFVHGYPYVSISLGLAINRTPQIGVVYNPFTRDLYTGIYGKGAYYTPGYKTKAEGQKAKLPFRDPPEAIGGLERCVVCVEWGSDRGPGGDYEVKTKTFANICRNKSEKGGMAHGIRSFGSAALNLCGVAAGGLDVYWEAGCWAWDVCAGWYATSLWNKL